MGKGTAAHVPPRDRVTRLPNAPGVYRFRDAYDHVLYIGRAVNLRRRVGSYWSHPSGHLAEMVSRGSDNQRNESVRQEHEAQRRSA